MPDDLKAQSAAQSIYDLRYQLALDVIDAARRTYPDFDTLRPLIEIVAAAFRPECIDWSKIQPSEYVELLYLGVRHSSFAAGARASLIESERMDGRLATELLQ